MIKNPDKLRKFYQALEAQERISYKQALKIFESLYNEALSFGVINDDNILEGIDTTIRVAKILNSLN